MSCANMQWNGMYKCKENNYLHPYDRWNICIMHSCILQAVAIAVAISPSSLTFISFVPFKSFSFIVA